MKPSFFFRIAATLAAMLLLPACTQDAGKQHPAAPAEAIRPALIPVPATLQTGSGEFVVDAGTKLHADSDAARRVAERFNAFLAAAKWPELKPGESGAAGGIRFETVTAGTTSPEAYSLDVTPDGVVVRATDERGLFYGAVTLWQLLTQGENGRVALPALHIDDTPRFPWRGLMLDSARHFQSVDEIKRLLDAMALHKLNVFHWHLTDDQGWRIEIRKYPKLTEVGGCRIPAGDAGIDPATGKPAPYCGFYTQDQIRDVVAYAAARHIDVVPEIDVPGHATAAIAAYPELGLLGEAPAVSNEWGVHANLFSTEESTFRFLEDVFGEVAALFPGEYVHIGGDEAVKDQWIASRHVQQRMKELGAKDEMAMQGLLVARLEKLLAASGKRLIGWDEILEGDLPPSATVMSWRGTEGGIAAANRGHDVVMAPVDKLYLDYLQSDSPDEVPGRPTLSTLKDVYDFEPLPPDLPEDRQQHILGLQANAWTEHMRTFDRVQHQVFPRIAALAETGWSPAAKKNYDDFLVRLPTQLRRYDALGIKYAKTPFEKKAVAQGNSRSDEQMALCSRTVALRLEDDGPFTGERAIFNVDIFNPCWEWKQARLAGIGAVEVRAGRIPYNFQLAHDEKNRSFKPAKSAHGEMVIRAGCDGAELANVPLPAQPDADGFVTLQAPIPARSQPTDLCVYFTGDTRPTMWVLDRITLTKK